MGRKVRNKISGGRFKDGACDYACLPVFLYCQTYRSSCGAVLQCRLCEHTQTNTGLRIRGAE